MRIGIQQKNIETYWLEMIEPAERGGRLDQPTRFASIVSRRAAMVLLAAAVLAAAAVLPGEGRAQAAVPSVLEGTWHYDGPPATAMRTVEAAFAASIATLPELLRGFARDRIRSSMEPPRRVLVALEGARVRVRLEAQRTTIVDGPLGSAARVSGVEDGTGVTPRLESGSASSIRPSPTARGCTSTSRS
jgi:hypothetical protein